MKKATILTVVLISSYFCFAQKKDSVKPVQYDTAFVLSFQDMAQLKTILMESKLTVNGSPLSGKELQQLFGWLDSRLKPIKKEQPLK